MLLRLVHPIAIAIARPLSRSLLFNSRTNFSTTCELRKMGRQSFHPQAASFRLCNVSSYTTEVLEILSEDPALHVLFIPGNPGVVTFYKDFVESLYQLLGGTVSITAVGHISHSRKVSHIYRVMRLWLKRSGLGVEQNLVLYPEFWHL
ncbi:hypothetical protein SAY86_014922 [Trapa natans]|uniref:Uncharacterized protein n=1 Tax=Trapa natans TaxID=22666 RepID=A0AAN7KIT1_TRANT|nr:hypothetical protein SAY86_014922 [Trapa natans]